MTHDNGAHPPGFQASPPPPKTHFLRSPGLVIPKLPAFVSANPSPWLTASAHRTLPSVEPQAKTRPRPKPSATWGSLLPACSLTNGVQPGRGCCYTLPPPPPIFLLSLDFCWEQNGGPETILSNASDPGTESPSLLHDIQALSGWDWAFESLQVPQNEPQWWTSITPPPPQMLASWPQITPWDLCVWLVFISVSVLLAFGQRSPRPAHLHQMQTL